MKMINFKIFRRFSFSALSLIFSVQAFAYAPLSSLGLGETSFAMSTAAVNNAVIFKSADDGSLKPVCRIDLGLHPKAIPSFAHLKLSDQGISSLSDQSLPACSASRIEMVEALAPTMQLEPKLAAFIGVVPIAIGVAGSMAAYVSTIGAGVSLKAHYMVSALASTTAGYCAVAGGLIGYFWD